jgi:hypothetical protein
MTVLFGCIICKTKPKYSDFSMGIIGGGYLIVEGCVGDYREQLPAFCRPATAAS